MQRRRVVVTGIGIISPLGNTRQESWAGAKEGRSGVGQITRFDAAAFATHFAAEVKGFSPDPFIEFKEQKKQDLFSQYAVAGAHEALTDAKLLGDKTSYDAAKMGCVLGVGIGGLMILEKYYAAYLEGGPKKISPFLIPGMISNLGPGNVAIKYGLKGVNYTVTSACTSSTHAIGEAFRMIADGMQDMMVTGGAESTVSPVGIGGFCALKALSTRNDDPQRASRPFDKDRDGFVLGEGCTIMVLEALDNAVKRGAQIYGEVLGYGTSCDAHHMTAPSVDGEGAINCMRNALQWAGLNPNDIGYLNAHGTSTPANDSSETAAIKTVFGAWAHNGLLVSSTKSMTGHLLGAAGAIEAAFCLLAMRDSIVPPTINLDNPDEGCDLDYVPHKARQHKVQIAMSNSFGFGGTNASLIFGAYKG
ncbi:MAG: beta-ketoacyl-ACP synthase II [bacterium]|jgi:3-oxoacyl-[acyl-carrier-protein] synthase II